MRLPRSRHICLRAPGKCACNAINAFQTQLRYGHTFSVSQECVCNGYLLYLFGLLALVHLHRIFCCSRIGIPSFGYNKHVFLSLNRMQCIIQLKLWAPGRTRDCDSCDSRSDDGRNPATVLQPHPKPQSNPDWPVQWDCQPLNKTGTPCNAPP